MPETVSRTEFTTALLEESHVVPAAAPETEHPKAYPALPFQDATESYPAERVPPESESVNGAPTVVTVTVTGEAEMTEFESRVPRFAELDETDIEKESTKKFVTFCVWFHALSETVKVAR